MSDQTEHNGKVKPVVLCILDGWGHRDERDNNAIALAKTPTWDRWMATTGRPHALVETSGLDVGLPDGQMGNSEVGHMNIGAGRVVLQGLPQINAAITEGSFGSRPVLTNFIATLKASGGACHLMGLVSPGGVHAHQTHIVALAQAASKAGIPVRIHAFLDGRDTPPQSALEYMSQFIADIEPLNDVVIATVSGRYYSMDRDNRWDRVERAFTVLVDGADTSAPDALTAIKASYADGKTDEFIDPVVIDGYTGMTDGDSIIMANFRADRAREILSALLEPEFDGFARGRVPRFTSALGMAEYSTDLSEKMAVLFPSEAPQNGLGQVVADAGLKQLRIAETEKYAHVTFFLNGGIETEFPGEQRILVPSPKVATYDQEPAMSAAEVTDKLVEAIESSQFDLVVVNYANGDMVGHTGILSAAMTAAETIDACLTRLEQAVEEAGGAMLVTADHGNCELMEDPETKAPHTAHTIGTVPVVLVSPAINAGLHDGRLADLAPTVLDLMGLPQPTAMTGQSLLDLDDTARRRAAE
ncbi:MAG: 2,3-bisphosphoglycerate-independent phosphoglycerate mutase [Rhodospirillaceae bacterium]|jgi:2,3-bisphosphoglycerate-independent phosphoglycerate mutase|nr:2,3-bisphosphoglycerate-independent phosphoglycerate mutase [Rhodospirillaceae bacterium]MBT5566047.1 2,3-bisphosphoglycerate-independent phosphoglycerate mutase [Rhodospirillaceae bacterium]MBT6088999.1 2,3-bisphosphoglycerate-independent phosphoglycerate mutase [Rhodospirillaceae bacterium]MBT7450374.1 2,3-bisphosphoglycerate-independent phosphoglycerate mutase [Rhodospirillaceae bacterium]